MLNLNEQEGEKGNKSAKEKKSFVKTIWKAFSHFLSKWTWISLQEKKEQGKYNFMRNEMNNDGSRLLHHVIMYANKTLVMR